MRPSEEFVRPPNFLREEPVRVKGVRRYRVFCGCISCGAEYSVYRNMFAKRKTLLCSVCLQSEPIPEGTRRKISETLRGGKPQYVVDPNTGCWVWQCATHGGGYGALYEDGRLQNAHRVFYKRLKGTIPEGLDLDHLCRVRLCVNPSHLEPVTRAENLRRGREAKAYAA